MRGGKGFTLIEILVVVVIMGIFLSISYPFYVTQQKRMMRASVQAAMLSDMERMMLYNARYRTAGIAIAERVYSNDYPTYPGAVYKITVESVPALALVAKPAAGQIMQGDGWICIDVHMRRSWQPGVEACNLSATSTWYGE